MSMRGVRHNIFVKCSASIETPVTPDTNTICYCKLLLEFKNTRSGAHSVK